MKCPQCPKCELAATQCTKVVRDGTYYRTADSRLVQRFFCMDCRLRFSSATFERDYRQRKRRVGRKIAVLFAQTNSIRGIARSLHLNRKTVVRKFRSQAGVAKARFHAYNQAAPRARAVQFDELETFEQTKCKPLSVMLAVEEGTRRILGFDVAPMPASGLLAKRAREKYGYRADLRNESRHRVFASLQGLIEKDAMFKSDSNPHYPAVVKRHFPEAQHVRVMGKRGAVTGQGELKKIGFDPIFSLNHTCAMLRANVNRLIRKTWCTTKKAERLLDHLYIYAWYHNEFLLKAPQVP